MGQKTAYLQGKILAANLGAVAYTPPATYYVVASLSAFDPSTTGATASEPTGGSYARVAVPNNLTNFSAVAGSSPTTLSNLLAWTFPTATADQGTYLSIYLSDSATIGAGNLHYGDDVTGGGFPANSGTTPRVGVGAFFVRES